MTEAVPQSSSICARCIGLCCRYFALPIDNPGSAEDFDNIRWYLSHENIHVFIDGGDWYMAVLNRCQHLTATHECGIYEDRPRVCREFSNTDCDFHDEPFTFEQYFVGPDELEAYAQATLGQEYTDFVVHQRRLNMPNEEPGPAEGILARRRHTGVRGHPGRRPVRGGPGLPVVPLTMKGT